MKKTVKLSLLFLTMSLLFSGCDNKTAKAKVINEAQIQASKKPAVTPQQTTTKTDTKTEVSNNIIYDVFKDSAKIGPEGRYLLLVFGINTDPYTDQLKKDIKNNSELSKRIKNNFSSFYLKAHENLRHKLFHEGEYMDVDTKTMISIYGVDATPTLIFSDLKGKAVIVVPGYMPAKQFLATLDFIESKKWEGKDRKNGEVYQALKDFYIEKGILKK